MDKKETHLQEQEAPLKNTDNAFVKVNKDGSPSLQNDKKPEENTGSRTHEKSRER